MTGTRGNTSRRDARARAQARIRLQDLANTWACTRDEQLRRRIDGMFARCLSDAEKAMGDAPRLYVDGSYNQDRGTAGIGVSLALDPSLGPGEGPNLVFGKSVRASGSAEAEIYAMAVGLSWLMDTCPDVTSAVLRYDRADAAVSAANLNAYAGKGAPYTNMRSAMKRLERAGVTVLFRHVKAHATDEHNGMCDAIAKHYARVPLSPAQERLIAPYTARPKTKGR